MYEKSLDSVIVLMTLNKPRKSESRYWVYILVEFGENWYWQFSDTYEIIFLAVFHIFLSEFVVCWLFLNRG